MLFDAVGAEATFEGKPLQDAWVADVLAINKKGGQNPVHQGGLRGASFVRPGVRQQPMGGGRVRQQRNSIEGEGNAGRMARLLQLRPSRRHRAGTAQARPIKSLVGLAFGRRVGQERHRAPQHFGFDSGPQPGYPFDGRPQVPRADQAPGTDEIQEHLDLQ